MGNDELIVKTKRPKGEDGYKVFSIRIKEETVSKIDAISVGLVVAAWQGCRSVGEASAYHWVRSYFRFKGLECHIHAH